LWFGASTAADPGRAEEDYAACACAVLNLLLSVHADGVGAKWHTGGPVRDPETFRILGLDPAQHKIVALVAIGWPEIVPATPARPPLSELVRTVP
jgi:nitroreductase